MAGTFPRYRLYETDGVTLIWEFDYVTDDPGMFNDPGKYVEHESLRGQGSIIVPGGDAAFDIILQFILKGDDYEDLVAQMEAAIAAIPKYQRFMLRVQKTPSTTKDYRVQRLTTIQWPNDRKMKRVKLQTGIITFRALTWA